ncbi:MAG TPA: hypothetical protein VG406_08420 [Isosphaeraceae bacterium]|jgi:hypothetical protein|nr:hypothetical protein [Isosphaeraceae bacterium]
MSTLEIVVEEKGADYAVVRPSLSKFRMEMELERLPALLDRTLTYWLADRPSLRVRTVLPVVEDGFTVAIHVWYDDASVVVGRR